MEMEKLTLDEAFDLLWNGKLIRLKNDLIIDITDIISREVLDNQLIAKSEYEIKEFLKKKYNFKNE